MSVSENLIRKLRYGDIPDVEWFMLLSGLFGARTSSFTEMRYFYQQEPTGDDYALKLSFTESKHKLKLVTAGPKFTKEILEKINQLVDEVLKPSSLSEVSRWVLFNRFEVIGKLKISDDAQIIQMPDGAPKPKFNWIEGQPFVVEVKQLVCSNKVINEYRARKRFFTLNRLLNLILRDGVYEYSNFVSDVWVRDHENGKTTSHYRQRGYTVDNFKRQQEEFSDVSLLPDISITHRDIYFKMDGWDGKTPFNVPDNLFGLIKDYDSITSEEKEMFDNALYWFSRVYRVEENDESVNFLCLISAVESLLPSPENRGKCDACDTNLSDSVQERFRNFFSEYAPQVDQKTVTQLYEFRSSLAHGRSIHRGDIADDITGIYGRLNPNVMKDNAKSRAARIAVRIVLINWLGSHGTWMGYRIKDLRSKD